MHSHRVGGLPRECRYPDQEQMAHGQRPASRERTSHPVRSPRAALSLHQQQVPTGQPSLSRSQNVGPPHTHRGGGELRPPPLAASSSPRERHGLHRSALGPSLPPPVHSLSGERPMGHFPGGRPPTMVDRPARMSPVPHGRSGLNDEGVAGLDGLTSVGPESGVATSASLSARGVFSFADAAHLRDYTSSLSSLGDSNRTSPASATQGTEGGAHAHLGLYGLGMGIGMGGGTRSPSDGSSGDGVVPSGSGAAGGWIVPTSMGTSFATAAESVSYGASLGGGNGSGGSGISSAAGGGGGGRPQHLSASIARHACGGDPRLGIHVNRAETADGWGRQDSRRGASTVIDQAPESGLTHALYGATDGFMGYPGANGLTPAANDRLMYDSLPRYPAYGGVGHARGMAIWQPPPFSEAASTAEEAQYQQLAGLGPWNTAVTGDGNHGRTSASPEALTTFSDRTWAYEVHAGPTGHRGGDRSPAAAAPTLRQASLEPTFQDANKDMRERLRHGDSPFDGACPGGEASLRDTDSGVAGGGGGAADGNVFPSAHIWSFGEAAAKEGVQPAGTLGQAYNPWSLRGWGTHTTAAGMTPPPPSGTPPH